MNKEQSNRMATLSKLTPIYKQTLRIIPVVSHSDACAFENFSRCLGISGLV